MRFTRPGACAASVGVSPKASLYAALAGGVRGRGRVRVRGERESVFLPEGLAVGVLV